jgi:hypothetical protein
MINRPEIPILVLHSLPTLTIDKNINPVGWKATKPMNW